MNINVINCPHCYRSFQVFCQHTLKVYPWRSQFKAEAPKDSVPVRDSKGCASHGGVFRCPKCGSSRWGTSQCTQPFEQWIGHCSGCDFVWHRATQDSDVFTARPAESTPGPAPDSALVLTHQEQALLRRAMRSMQLAYVGTGSRDFDFEAGFANIMAKLDQQEAAAKTAVAAAP